MSAFVSSVFVYEAIWVSSAQIPRLQPASRAHRMAHNSSKSSPSSASASASALQRSAADTVVGNDDLVTEILLRLPVKSVTRFKSVSKLWLSLIADPRFSLLHHARRNCKAVSGLFFCSLKSYPDFAFVPLDDECLVEAPHFEFLAHRGTTIFHSCNGLLCYSKFDHSEDRSILKFYVCNPTTKQSATIPLLGLVRNCRIRRGYRVEHKLCNVKTEESTGHVSELNINFLGIYLVFDPLRSPHYRVVCVWEWDASLFNYGIKIAVYSSGTGFWGEPIGPFTVPYGLCFNNGVFWNGRVHWISNKEMVCFDVDGGYIKIMTLPFISNGLNVVYFGESRSHLHIVVNENASNALLHVFEMERDYSAWIGKYCCDLGPAMILSPERVLNFIPGSFYLIFLERGEKEDESCIMLGICGQVICYNLKSRTSKKLCNLPPFFQKSGWPPCAPFKAFTYDETLFEV